MNSVVTAGFLDRLGRLPDFARHQASHAYALWRADSSHPNLRLERVSQRQAVYSPRVGLGHRALGFWEDDLVTWFWIGSHAEYATLLDRR